MKVSEWSRNTALCAHEKVFSRPYCICDTNHWTPSAQIDGCETTAQDSEIKTAAAKLKDKFVESTSPSPRRPPQRQRHGEGQHLCDRPGVCLHGPMGFDVGAILANRLGFLHRALTPQVQGWLLEQMVSLHEGFTTKFLSLWDATVENSSADSELYRSVVFNEADSVKMAQRKYMASLWADTIGFMGMKMIRKSSVSRTWRTWRASG